MKQIILEKEWLEILDGQSPEFMARVMSAIFAFIPHETEPAELTQAERIAYEFIMKNIQLYQQRYDLEAGYEAVIKRRRAEEARKRRAEQNPSQKAQPKNDPKMITPIKHKQKLTFNPLPADGLPESPDIQHDDCLYSKFRQFYISYTGPKDSCSTEYARLRHQYPDNTEIPSALNNHLQRRYKWIRDIARLGFHSQQLPPMARFITEQCWNDLLPDLEHR